MDVNGTRYQLLLGEGDWRECADASGVPLRVSWKDAPPADASTKLAPSSNPSQLAWDADRHELTLQPRLFRFVAAPDDVPPDFARRRGAARDRYENWYWIDETRARVSVRSAGSLRTTEFWSAALCASLCAGEGTTADDGSFRAQEIEPLPSFVFGGLAVTEDHYLVVGTVEPRGFLVFDLHAGGAPQLRRLPVDVEFEPFDMGARAGGGVVILDRRHKRIWEFDRTFSVVTRDETDDAQEDETTTPDAFHAEDEQSDGGTPAVEEPRRITKMSATQIDDTDPVAVESLPDGSVLILDGLADPQFAEVRRYRDGRQVGAPGSTRVMLDLIEEERQADFRLAAYDFACVPGREARGKDEGVPDRLYVVAADGNQSYSFRLGWRGLEQFELVPEPVYLPMRLFGGAGLVRAGTGAYYDFDDRWIPLAEQRRPRYVEAATLVTPIKSLDANEPDRTFDGQEPDCVWHRLLLDACIPAGTRVEVWSRAANDESDLEIAGWSEEPRLYLRADGSELPYVGRLDKQAEAASKERAGGDGTWELLFQRARGRYLQLKLVLTGDGRSTPRLRALRAYYPRFSYSVNYLPGVYREDEQSASFLERFLANFEGTYTALEDKIGAVQLLFDVRSAPSDALEWLAGWYGVALDPAWDEPRRRVFIKNAMHFFAYRGTTHGLELALRLVFDECVDDSAFTVTPPDEVRHNMRGIRLVERFRARNVPAALVGDPSDTDAPGFVPVARETRWQPSDSSEWLHKAYREQLNLTDANEFPISKPGGERGVMWEEFARRTLGFVPSATAADAGSWRDFLARRYRTVKALNAAHESVWGSFTDVTLPASLPARGAQLFDWYGFESIVVAMRRAAHRFTVLLPVPRTDTFGTDEQRARVALTQRIIDLEKPAHTKFEIKFYWAMFRLGSARLGEDTLLDYGSRAGALAPPLVLGLEHLAESRLAPTHPWDVQDRTVVGRC
ncbi:MAG: phage tail protein [Pyrinomonadaceae bacterium]